MSLRYFVLILLMTPLGFFVGCRSVDDRASLAVARFYLEAGEGEAGLDFTLPQSDVVVRVNPRPVLVEYDFLDVQIARVELGECLLFQLNGGAARDLYRLSAANQGRRLVLTINGQPLGARRLDQPIGDGVVMVFAETPDTALPELVQSLQKTAIRVQRGLTGG